MQRPKLSPPRSRLLAYLVATILCPTLWTSPSLQSCAYAAEILSGPEYAPLVDSTLQAVTDGHLSHVQDAGAEVGEGAGYEPEFSYLDRSIIGRQTSELNNLTANVKMEKDIAAEETIYFVFEKSQMRLRQVEVPQEALEALGTDSGSEGVKLADSAGAHDDQDAVDTKGIRMNRRQTGTSHVWVTANTCQQPMPVGNATEASKNHPQLVMYVSTSSKNQKPGPDATQNTITNLTGVLFDSGYANFAFNASSDVYIGISAPKLEQDWFGSWHFELAASTDGPYHYYNNSDPFLYMIDTDSESALFITYDLGNSNSTQAVEEWTKNNPFNMYAFEAGEYTPINGMEHSYCALKEQFNVNTTKNFTIDSSITTKFSGDDLPKAQFHVRNLETAKTYNGFVVIEGAQEPTDISSVGVVRGGGTVFQAFNWTTKADDSCQVLSDLEFCDMVAYAVPSRTFFKYNDSALAEIYDNQARSYYDNFTKSLEQVACDTVSEAQYSLAKTCTDCQKDYKNWLCLVLMPRCEDWTANDPWLQPRDINVPFRNGSLTYNNNVSLAFNETYRDRFAYSQSRNPLIDEVIVPGPYKEMLPCEDMCWNIVKSCPAQLGLGCPNSPGRESAYGKRSPNPDQLTCNFPGAVVKLNASSFASGLVVRLGSTVLMGILVGLVLWV